MSAQPGGFVRWPGKGAPGPGSPATAAVGSAEKPSAGGHLVPLDVWRGLAIGALLLGHFLPTPGLNLGRLGVELFFVLSGFLMGGLLFVKATPIGLFYRRRIARIFPAAYAFLLINLGLLLWSNREIAWAGVASCFGFYSNYFMALDPVVRLSLPATHFWSLCIEEHTYVVLSLLALSVRRWKLPPVRLVVAAMLVCYALALGRGLTAGWDYRAVYWRTETRGASILAGCLMALWSARGLAARPCWLGIPTTRLGGGALVLGLLLQASPVPDFLKYSGGSLCLALGLLMVAQHGGGWLWNNPVIAWLGTVSYSLYLWQQPFYYAVVRGKLTTVAGLIGALAAGAASFYLLERPVRLWLNAHWGTVRKSGG